ncbi:hypothetical protein, partial [Stenotrophomonas sp.]|uniref:hypothetical protein n=1 Tax=Stenotrophomonas sp. TaxID=69392 RepID=UPI003D111D25
SWRRRKITSAPDSKPAHYSSRGDVAVRNPLSITGQSGGRFMMTGKDAVVIVNHQGKVITTWATNAAGVR